MFKNLFKNLNSDKGGLGSREERLETKPIIDSESRDLVNNVSGDLGVNPEQRKQYEEVQITGNTPDNGRVSIPKKPATKTAKKYTEYKLFYINKLTNCKSIDEVLDIYIKHTDSNDMMDELRLRYVSMYLFKTSLSYSKLSIKDLKLLLVKKLSKECIIENIVMQNDEVNEIFYKELKLHLENKTSIMFQGFEKNLSIDSVLLSVFSHYGLELIDSDLFVKVLFELIEDMDLPGIDNKNDNIKNHLRQKILSIKDTEFWDPDEKKIYRCEIFIVGRYIMVKTTDFISIFFKSGEGPIYISEFSLDIADKFGVYIQDDTYFIMDSINKAKIFEYFDYVNGEILAEVNQKVEIITEGANNASSELRVLINNFIGMIPLSILLDTDSYIAFEHLISFSSFIAQQLLDSNTEQRDNITDRLKEDSNFHNNINYFINDSFKKLVKIAGKYINISEGYHSSVIWKLIRQSAPQFVSEYWKNEYGIYFKNDIQMADLSEYIDEYCRCSDISTKNVFAIGSFTYYLMNKGIFPAEINENFVQCNIYLINKILQKVEGLELKAFENKLADAQVQESAKYSINDVDLMDGYEFEQFIGLLFTKMGYTTEITKGSGDQGMDIIAERDGNRIGIQAKCYSNKVTNKAVQEIFSSLNYYNCGKGVVITNNYFTDSALELAQSNNIVLWDRDILKRKIDEVFN